MKKLLAIAFAALMLISFVSCGGGGGGEITLPPEDDTTASGATGDGFSFAGGTSVSVAPHDNLAAFIAAAGKAVSYEESNSCAYLGLDKIWVYSGYTIYSYPKDGVDYLLQLVFTDDSVKTDEGISIGMTADEVKTAYGNDYASIGEAMVYTKGVTSLKFGIKDGKVTQVIYSAN
ncbi:MAG: hypothetical protein MJ137_05455 [Clostridia bacterium]|nr:hypothetical protein [Clostridia bacterium]